MQILILFADLSLKILQKILQNTKQYILHQLVILYFKRVNLLNQYTVDTVIYFLKNNIKWVARL